VDTTSVSANLHHVLSAHAQAGRLKVKRDDTGVGAERDRRRRVLPLSMLRLLQRDQRVLPSMGFRFLNLRQSSSSIVLRPLLLPLLLLLVVLHLLRMMPLVVLQVRMGSLLRGVESAEALPRTKLEFAYNPEAALAWKHSPEAGTVVVRLDERVPLHLQRQCTFRPLFAFVAGLFYASSVCRRCARRGEGVMACAFSIAGTRKKTQAKNMN
jgi:hypothetical protein